MSPVRGRPSRGPAAGCTAARSTPGTVGPLTGRPAVIRGLCHPYGAARIPRTGRRVGTAARSHPGDGRAAHRPPRAHPGSCHPYGAARILRTGRRVHRCPQYPGDGRAAHRPPRGHPGSCHPYGAARILRTGRRVHRCPQYPGDGRAAHRPPHGLRGQTHCPRPAQHSNPSAPPLDAQCRYALHPSAQPRRHDDPRKQADLALRLCPGRQSPGRNHVPPDPSHADRTSHPPRLPLPLPSGPSTYPHTVFPLTQTEPAHTAVRAASVTEATLTHDVRRRPTLPRGPPRSTIGAEELNFRVRNGTGCFPFAMTAETLWRFRSSAFPGGLPVTRPTAPREPHSGRERTAWESPPRRRMYEPSLSAY